MLESSLEESIYRLASNGDFFVPFAPWQLNSLPMGYSRRVRLAMKSNLERGCAARRKAWKRPRKRTVASEQLCTWRCTRSRKERRNYIGTYRHKSAVKRGRRMNFLSWATVVNCSCKCKPIIRDALALRARNIDSNRELCYNQYTRKILEQLNIT